MFEHTSSSGPYYGSKLGWSGFNWVLRRQDGSVGIFRACSDTGPDLCTVRELRDPRGRAVHFIRNGTFTRLLAMRSGNQSIDFQYDDHDRIVRATGGPGHDARYTYDEGGRLIRVLETQVANPAKPKIVERRYTYDARGAMLTIDEPGHHIENTYDEAGRCVRQVIRHADGETSEFRVSYRVEGKRIVQTATAWDEGPVTIYTWDANRETQTEQRDALGQWPVTIDYNRSPLSSRSRGVTVHCLDAIGRELRHAEGADDSDAAVDALVQATCH
jgi:YD repeat-containing protein